MVDEPRMCEWKGLVTRVVAAESGSSFSSWKTGRCGRVAATGYDTQHTHAHAGREHTSGHEQRMRTSTEEERVSNSTMSAASAAPMLHEMGLTILNMGQPGHKADGDGQPKWAQEREWRLNEGHCTPCEQLCSGAARWMAGERRRDAMLKL